jgi:glycosyltransferase involved in cell wall biosynthesis
MSASPSGKTAVVIPTRNRADLAMTAIRSVISQPVSELQLIVSDNSTDDANRTVLEDFCRQLADPRVVYVRPPNALPMTAHWEWAIHQALALPDLAHVVYLTDRSMFKPGELAHIIELARRNPGKVISYDWVTIFDHLDPILVEQREHTGRVIDVTAERLLYLSSQSLISNCLPRLMNACVPRSVVESVLKEFGSVFASISPDYHFCYRCLAVVDSILYYDAAAFVSYAILRSNGVSTMGMSTPATVDFNSQLTLNQSTRSFAAPVPAFETFANYALHEYCLVKEESADPRFHEVNREKYLARNASEAASNGDVQLKREKQTLLKAHGWRPFQQRLLELRTSLSLRTRARKLLRLQWPVISTEIGPFGSLEEAIKYAIRIPLSEDSSAYHLRLLRD